MGKFGNGCEDVTCRRIIAANFYFMCVSQYIDYHGKKSNLKVVYDNLPKFSDFY